MTNSHQKLQQLSQIARLRLEIAQFEMRTIVNQETRLRKNLKDLSIGLDRLRAADQLINSPAKLARADLRWKTWVDQRRRSINLELSQVLVRKEVIRENLKLAVGKEVAIRALIKSAVDRQAKTNRRRTYYAS